MILSIIAAVAVGLPAGTAPGDAIGPVLGRDEIVVTAGDETGGGTFGIYVMKTDGSNLRLLANDPTFESTWARISPDRSQIVFHRSNVGAINELQRYWSTSIWLMNADGSGLREIRPAQTDGWALQGHVEWAPNGRELLVFAREASGSPTQLYLLDLNGSVIRRVTDTPGDTADASFSPDGTQIVFAGCPDGGCPSADIYLMPTDGSTPPMGISAQDSVQDNDPYFSPDGATVTWNRNRATQLFPLRGESLAVVADLETDGLGNPIQVGDNQLNAVPTWSLDGTSLLIHRFDFNGTKQWDAVRLSVETGAVVNLTAQHRTGEMTDWSFWFPHAGTPSSLGGASEALAPPTDSTRQEAATEADGPPNWARVLVLVTAAGISLLWWRRWSGRHRHSSD